VLDWHFRQGSLAVIQDWKEVWPLLSVNKTGLERGLRRLRRKDLLEVALCTGTSVNSQKIEFYKRGG